ncbi:MAG: flippase-like domain-containing protein [Chlorobiaceae bacterium]|nr:flippase-like domain-containing protein [Chlorobiaceae bacterium]NTV60410.1 flippase-like domain-containing protein [Chlorobiaceae bacterium]
MKNKSISSWVGYAGMLLGVILIGYLFSQFDLFGVWMRIRSIGYASFFILLPFLGLHLIESFAWLQLFPGSTGKIPFFQLFKIQVIAETVSMTLPAGMPVGESLRPFLCRRTLDIPVPAGVASVAVRKLMLGANQGLYTLIGAIAGFSFLQSASQSMLGVEGLGYIMSGSGLAVFVIFLLFILLLLNGEAAQKVHALLMLIPFRKVKEWLLEKESGFHETDEELKAFKSIRFGKLVNIMLYYLTAWFMLAIESYIILKLLGVEITFFQVLAIDTTLSMLRAIFFFIPSGLGVQEIGYLAFFNVLGIGDAVVVGEAFVLLRRFKEILWYSAGYLVMFLSGVHLKDAHSGGSET